MNRLSRIFLVSIGALVLVATLAVSIPRAVRAGLAQLVQDVDSPPRNSWVGYCSAYGTSTDTASCTINLPPNSIVTIQTIALSGGFSSVSHDHLLLAMQFSSGGNPIRVGYQNVYAVTNSAPGIHNYFSTTPVTLYADSVPLPLGLEGPPPAGLVQITFSTDGVNPQLGGGIYLIGYSVPVAPTIVTGD